MNENDNDKGDESMFGQAILAVVLGIVLHQSEPFIEAINTDSATMKLLSRYGVGVLGNVPAFNMFMKLLGIDKRIRILVLMAYVVSFVFTGVGVFMGRVFRNLNSTINR